MDKKILKEYEQACAIIRETKGRMIALREKGEDEVRQTVKRHRKVCRQKTFAQCVNNINMVQS